MKNQNQQIPSPKKTVIVCDSSRRPTDSRSWRITVVLLTTLVLLLCFCILIALTMLVWGSASGTTTEIEAPIKSESISETKPVSEPEIVSDPSPDSESVAPFQIKSGEEVNFEIVSYALDPPAKRVSPRFYVYKVVDGKVSGEPQETTWITNGNIISSIPKPYKYPIWIQRESNVSYKWDVKKLEGHNDIIVTGATISAEEICKASDAALGKAFWITLSDGNKFGMKFIRRDGSAYLFHLTHYRICNPKYTYNISFKLRDAGNELSSSTQTNSRTHVTNVSNPINLILQNDETKQYILDVSSESNEHGSVYIQFNLNDAISRLNQEISAKPSEKSWGIELIQDENRIELKYTRP